MAFPLAAIGLGISAASSLASIGTGIFNSAKQNEANEKNYKLQKEHSDLEYNQYLLNKRNSERDFEYNKQLQEKIFQREDSAVQRMVADNRAAGLSPIAGLAGAGTGQALEANTPQLSQTFSTPQMSANQLNVDFSSLGQLGNQITSYEQSKDRLKLEQQRLGLEKSSNEANLKQMEANLEATKIKNQIARATIEDEIAGKKLSNQNVESVIAKRGADIVSQALGDDIKRLQKIQTKREMEEWLENKGLRTDLGNLSLDEAKAKVLALEMLNEHNSERYGVALEVLKEQKEALERENNREMSWDDTIADLGMDSGTGKLTGMALKFLMELVK